jgi:hypothetical protein
MMELAGIDLLPPEAGVPTIRRELCAGGTRGEVVVAGALGALLEERETDGGIAREAFAARAGAMSATVRSMTRGGGMTAETLLDPASHPFLNDHRIDGVPVLPGVMGIEAFAEAALLPLPGWRVEAVEDVRFLAPFKFYRDEPRTVTVEAVHRPDGEDVVAECRLIGSRVLAGTAETQVTTHFTGRVRLTRRPPDEGSEGSAAGDLSASVAAAGGDRVVAADIYRIYFHGPAYQVLGSAWRSGDGPVGAFADGLAPDRATGDPPFVLEPRLIELCFQTAGVWDLGRRRRLALPMAVERIVPAQGGFETVGAMALVRPIEDGRFDADVIDRQGRSLLQVRGYATVDLPGSPDPAVLAPIERGMG